MKYDVLIVGAGLYGAVFALESGKRCLIIDKSDHVAGMCHTKRLDHIDVHMYGAHIFHTDEKYIWEYVNKFSRFIPFVNSPIAQYKDRLFNLPFNMNTFSQLFGVNTPDEAKRIIEKERTHYENPKNLKEQALNLVGPTIFKFLIKDYTEKQWGKQCEELSPEIIKRIPLRFTFDNNYFNDRYQGIPMNGYTDFVKAIIERSGADVQLSTAYSSDMRSLAKTVVYTGAIDEYFDYCFGALEYRSLRFRHERFEKENVQGVPVKNYTSHDVPFTRTIEHKHFLKQMSPVSWVSYEYPEKYRKNSNLERYYPILDERNETLYKKYRENNSDKHVIFGGRLGKYAYFDMDDTIVAARNDVRRYEELL